jgi:hypothetical protein
MKIRGARRGKGKKGRRLSEFVLVWIDRANPV